MTRFSHLSLARRFYLLSFFLIFGAMFIVGAWTGYQIKTGVINLKHRHIQEVFNFYSKAKPHLLLAVYGSVKGAGRSERMLDDGCSVSGRGRDGKDME